MTHKLLVRGAGLMGASIGLAAREKGWEVRIDDVDTEATSISASVTGLPVMQEGFVPDLIVVAVPPASVAEVVLNAIRIYPQSIVIDIASVKTELKLQVESQIGISDKYVPTHPMAGKSVGGAVNASVDLLTDRRWVLCPNLVTTQSQLQVVEKLVTDCGSTPIYMTTETHDAAVAVTSHLPQLLSTLLAGQLDRLSDQDVAVSGPGLRDMTRLASSDVMLWMQIIKSNNRYIAEALEKFSTDFQRLQNALSTNNLVEIEKLFERGLAGRARIPGKHGDRPQQYAIVAVLIDDKPGQLAGIFACAGAADINIEDVRIDHALGREVAIVELSIKPDRVLALQDALLSEGWSLRPAISAD